MERGEVKQPKPQVLRRLAIAYDEPFELLMQLAGYIETDPEGLSPNARRALSFLGPNPSDDELEALKTILSMMRKGQSATFTPIYSLALDDGDRQDIRRSVLACLREADAIGVYPTPLDDLLRVAELARSGEIQLSVEDRKLLRAKFGEVAMRVLRRLEGVIDFRSNEVWVNPDIHPMKQRFVGAHEVGHKLLEWQRDTFAYLDDGSRLRPDVRDLFERQANEAAIELLTQGGRLREEADDDNPPSLTTVQRLSAQYGISLQGTARYIAERSERACACALAFKRDDGSLAPYHLFASTSLQSRLGWGAGREPQLRIDAVLCSRGMWEARPPLNCTDVKGREVALDVGVLDTPRARIAWFGYKPRRLSSVRG